jgi:beta-lactamase regulating signal transducer with metallopeptidase domain
LSALVIVSIKQPAKRRAVTQSTLVGLILLAALCALPGWSLLNLTRATQTEPVKEAQSVRVQVAQTSVETTLRVVAPPLNEPPKGIPIERIEPAESQTASAPADLPRAPIPWRSFTLIAWATGAALTVAWLALGWSAARRLHRDSHPAPAYLLTLLRSLTSNHRGRAQDPQLLVCTQIDVAVALGVVHPAVLLPADWLQSQSNDDLHTVLAHEAAHLRNYDLHWLAVSRVLSIALWAQPLYWFVRRRMRLDQEALADAAAAELTSRQNYAEKLVALAHHVAARPAVRLSTAVGLWEGPSQLRRRVALLIDDHFTHRAAHLLAPLAVRSRRLRDRVRLRVLTGDTRTWKHGAARREIAGT